MNHPDDFLKKITQKLDQAAQQHENKPILINNVLEQIQKRKDQRFGLWKVSGFAVAAAIASLLILPSSVENHIQPNTPTSVVTPKLSPQMVEDLEMLSLLGDEVTAHDS